MSTSRFFHPDPLAPLLQSGATFALSDFAARHVQVLRLQPDSVITLFDGLGGEYTAQVVQMTRSSVSARLTAHHDIEREALSDVALAICCPANERMDWLVEKATELGVREIYPLVSERVVLRLSGERADKRREHWKAIAVSACEQSGRNRVPVIHPLTTLKEFIGQTTARQKWMLSLSDGSQSLSTAAFKGNKLASLVLCGPEGGLSHAEEALAISKWFAPVSLANRVLRSETAALAALSVLTA